MRLPPFALAALVALPSFAGPLSKAAEADFAVTTFVQGLGDVTDFAFLPDGRVVITEKSGGLKIRKTDGSLVTAATFEVDDASEKGLLGVAVDPKFAETKRLFLYYSAANAVGGNNLDRHRVISAILDGDKLDRKNEKLLVRGLRGPANHDGGALAIGPDGKLYIGVGDTGCNSNRRPEPRYEPTNHFGGCLTNANGKILRVELDGSIPADNPLASVERVTACGSSCREPLTAAVGAPRREIWAWGFRNPWRFWFDPKTGKLWVGDVGEVTYEEITIAQAGAHHGWPWREGRHGWPRGKCAALTPSTGPCVEPIYECKHGDSRAAEDGKPAIDGDCQSITAGFIVDRCHWPDALRHRYYFADNANGRVWSLGVTPDRDGLVPGSRREIARYTDGIPVTVHEGPDGDVYVAVFPGNEGRIDRISPKAPKPCTP